MATAALMASESDHSPNANFFIVGAPKCGTTAWYEYLRSHPDIFFPELKEPCFFALDFPQIRHIASEADYSRLFAGSGAKVIGEASADYLFSQSAAEGIRNYNEHAKILILLRDQEEYLPSLHNQHLWGFWEEIEDFETAWKLSGRRPPDTIPASCTVPRMLDYAALGRFNEQVGRFLDAFPPQQVLVIRFREWVDNPRDAYLKILAFLGLEDDGRRDFPRINEAASHGSRRLARLLLSPTGPVRKLGNMAKRMTGRSPEKLFLAMERMVKLLSRRGYKYEISPELRAEIRRYYADDNRLLDERLRRVAGEADARPPASSRLTRQTAEQPR